MSWIRIPSPLSGVTPSLTQNSKEIISFTSTLFVFDLWLFLFFTVATLFRITPRKSDIIYSEVQGTEGLTLVERGTRISLTFRKIRHQPCKCNYPIKCDSQQHSETNHDNKLFVPISEQEASSLENEHVYDVYEEIAEHFSDTRHTPWPRVKNFLMGLSAGSLVADVGCGNGKYLGVNPHIVKVGSDRSFNLAAICRDRGFPVLVSDCLTLPYR